VELVYGEDSDEKYMSAHFGARLTREDLPHEMRTGRIKESDVPETESVDTEKKVEKKTVVGGQRMVKRGAAKSTSKANG
jgi:hypothetical protein